MPAQKGRDLLLKVDSDGTGAFITIAGLRSHRLAFATGTAECTSQLSPGQWRELLAGAGVRHASIAGSGIFKDDASDAAMRELFFADIIRDWQIIIPGYGIVQGPFQITALEYTGEHDGALTFELSLESAGQLTFTAI